MKQASRLKIDFQTACFDRTFNCVCCGSCIRTITACSLIVPTQPRNVGFARETARVGTISRRQRRNRTHEQAGRLKINFQTACFDRTSNCVRCGSRIRTITAYSLIVPTVGCRLCASHPNPPAFACYVMMIYLSGHDFRFIFCATHYKNSPFKPKSRFKRAVYLFRRPCAVFTRITYFQ